MTLKEEFATRNFSIYGQWMGILSMILCFALGIANIFTVVIIKIPFSVLAIVSSLIILFIEVPLLLRICPTSAGFDNFIRKITTNYMRAGAYAVMAIVQWLSILATASSPDRVCRTPVVHGTLLSPGWHQGPGFCGK
ncbi:Golgi apparatus membrane protein tvp18 [Collariella sp. IMI 366227]|nr:Golgi apparatus membrane protein tvp18 [Collariella sp. IMI 366227]